LGCRRKGRCIAPTSKTRAKTERWRSEVYPQIRARAASEGAEIFFADEAAVRTDFHTGTTWAPIGQTPVVESTGARRPVMMISAVSPKGKPRFMVHEDGLKAEEFIEFCRRLLADTPGKVFFRRPPGTVLPAAVLGRAQPGRVGMGQRQERPDRPPGRTQPERAETVRHRRPALPAEATRARHVLLR
jgi:hypothetical protein